MPAPQARGPRDVLFVAVRSARYLGKEEDVELSEFHVLMRPHAVAMLCQDNRWIDGSKASDLPENTVDAAARGDEALFDDTRLLQLGLEAVLYRLLDAIVDG